MDFKKITAEIQQQRRSVGFDSYDITIRQLIDMAAEGQIHVAPDYQRHFVWDRPRQSALIESIFLGIPVPSLFMATNDDATWEVIDGLQRITTILNFVNPEFAPDVASPTTEILCLTGLEKVLSLNHISFSDLPSSMRLHFLTRPMRITVLNDLSDFQVRFDLFERLNKGGVTLHAQEIRNCVFQGLFNDFIKECAADKRLDQLVKRNDRSGRGNLEELTLKLFAYFECRDNFIHSVKDFLNNYMEEKTKQFKNRKFLRHIFDKTLDEMVDALPNGVVRNDRPNTTPLVLFEAISVGVADIVSSGGEVNHKALRKLLDDDDLKKATTGATNSNSKLKTRIGIVSRIARK